MRASPLRISGAAIVECDRFQDDRGTFVTWWESAAAYPDGLAFAPVSAHQVTSGQSGTLRGMHFQRPPHAQSKLVSCLCGRVWEVVLDLRRDSPTYLQWEGVELRGADPRALLVPRGCAHGYVTLADRTTVAYLIEGAYAPEAADVVRWNDPAFRIAWPVPDPILSDKDRVAPDYLP